MQDPVIGTEEGKEERAVPGLTDLGNVCKHIARYNLALLRCEKKQVIDTACGSGYGSFILAMVAQSVLAVDCSTAAIEYARKHYSSPKIQHRVSDLYALTDECDVLVSFETVEHLPDLARYEEMVFRCLRSGGFLVYSVPLNETKGFNPYHKQLFTFESARNAFPSLTRREELIQHGINFYPPAGIPLHRPWLAYIGIYQKP